jgi:hypothetical protein
MAMPAVSVCETVHEINDSKRWDAGEFAGRFTGVERFLMYLMITQHCPIVHLVSRISVRSIRESIGTMLTYRTTSTL